ncbi:MAG: hypothetical protein J6X02_05160 [Bacilli bacterium]|nr:hypothetical protein [Bacilli bacterium]
MFTTSEIILLILVVSVILIVFVVLTVMDIKDYLRSKNKIVTVTTKVKEEIKDEDILYIDSKPEYEVNTKNVEYINVEEPKAILEESEIIFEEEKDLDPFFEEEEVIIPTKDEIIYKDVMTKEEARAELEKVEERLEKEKEISLQDTITNFEMEQEENAIISLDELMKVSDKLYESNEPVQYDDGDEPITIAEVIKKYNEVQNQKEEVEVVTAADTIKDTTSDLFVEEEEDFLTNLEIAHNNLHR